jgi:RimJ/RimL family protein N-acetyltransferase
VNLDRQPRLRGTLLELRPVREDDWDELFAVASDPLIWEQHPASDRHQEAVFREYFREALESGGGLVAIDRETGRLIGASRYVWHGGERNELEIGWSFLARAYWGRGYNREMKRLMLEHAFTAVDRVVFVVGEHNGRSRQAMLNIGGVLTPRTISSVYNGRQVLSVVYEISRADEGVQR